MLVFIPICSEFWVWVVRNCVIAGFKILLTKKITKWMFACVHECFCIVCRFQHRQTKLVNHWIPLSVCTTEQCDMVKTLWQMLSLAWPSIAFSTIWPFSPLSLLLLCLIHITWLYLLIFCISGMFLDLSCACFIVGTYTFTQYVLQFF